MSYPSHVPRFFHPNITFLKLLENYKTPNYAVFSGILRPYVLCFKNSHQLDIQVPVHHDIIVENDQQDATV